LDAAVYPEIQRRGRGGRKEGNRIISFPLNLSVLFASTLEAFLVEALPRWVIRDFRPELLIADFADERG
jgi:hypothetical protein